MKHAGLVMCIGIFCASLAARANDAGDAKEPYIGDLKAGRIVILGNSITIHGPKADIGWTGNWGMAASALEKDYVHLLLDRIATASGSKPEALVDSIVEFERNYETYDAAVKLKKQIDFKPDIVVLAMGENVPALGSEDAKAKFKAGVLKVLAALKSSGKPVIFVRGCFWPDAVKDGVLQQAAAESGAVFIDIQAQGKDESNYARSERKFENGGVAAHPGDKGMAAIADAIFAAIKSKGGEKPVAAVAPGKLPGGDAQRYLQFNTWSAGSDLKEFEAFKQRLDLAKDLGFNAVSLLIKWSDVEPTPGKYVWEGTDRNVDYAVGKGMKVTINFIAWVSPATGVVQKPDLMAGADGAVFGMWDCNFISFASEMALKKVGDVFQAVVERYAKRHPVDSYQYYQVSFSCYTEDEYSPGAVLLDYSAPAKARFRSWLQQRYGDIAAINAALQTQWASVEAIEPPQGHDGKVGVAWYLFRSEMLKRALDRMADLAHGVDPHIKFGVQVGSAWDQSCARRGTILFPALCEKADWVIVDDAPSYNHWFSADLLRSSVPGKKYANDFDGIFAAPQNTEGLYTTQTQQSFERGLHCVPVDNWSLADLQKHPDFFKKLSQLLTQPVPALKPAGQMKVSAQALLRGQAPLAEFDRLSEQGKKVLDVVLEDDLTPAVPPAKK